MFARERNGAVAALGVGFLLWLFMRGKATGDGAAVVVDVTPGVPKPKALPSVTSKPKSNVATLPNKPELDTGVKYIDVTPDPAINPWMKDALPAGKEAPEVDDAGDFKDNTAAPPSKTKGPSAAVLKAAKQAVSMAAKSKPPAVAKAQPQGSKVAQQLRALAPKPAKKVQPAGTKKVPAPAGVNVSLASSTAKDVARHISTKGPKYSRDVLKQFQTRAGMKPDGLYGPASADALRYFGANAPKPLFKGANAHYVPPT